MGGQYKDKTRRRIYNCWLNNINKCNNPNHSSYKNYGGQGISICEEWKNSFETFRIWALNNGYQDNLTIDRIDVNGDYCPENCRWVDMKIQQNNKRTNKYLTYNGTTLTERQWEEKLGLGRGTIRYRLQQNLPDELIFSTIEDFKRKKKSAKGELGKITCEQLYTINGETHNISEWAKIVGISKGNMKARFDQQLCDEDLLRKKRGKKNGKEKE